MLNTVFFDLGNVLLFFSHVKMFDQIANLTGIAKEEVQNIFSERKILEICEIGKMSSHDIYRIFQSLSSHRFTVDALMNAMSDIFIPNQNIWPIVIGLKKNKIRLVLLSNTSKAHFNKACSLCPLLKTFDSNVLSFEIGSLKPSLQFFKKAIAEANAPLTQCFYTDDVPEFIEGAKRVGLDGEVFTSANSLRKQLIERGCRFLA